MRNVEAARQGLAESQKIYQAMQAGPRQRVGLHWLSAEIALAEGDYLTAKILLEKIRETYRKAGMKLDYATAGIRLAKALFLLGDLGSLEEMVKETMSLLKPLSRFKLAVKVIVELQRIILEGKISAKNLDKLFFLIKARGRVTS